VKYIEVTYWELRQKESELLLFLDLCGCYCRPQQIVSEKRIFPEYICSRHKVLVDLKKKIGLRDSFQKI
jgi:hypothetical protein